MQQRTAAALSSTGAGESPPRAAAGACPHAPAANRLAGGDSGCRADADAGESSGESIDMSSDPQAQQQVQLAAPPPLVHWLASTDPATQRHARGILAAVQMATAISLWLQPSQQPAQLPLLQPRQPAMPAAEVDGESASTVCLPQAQDAPPTAPPPTERKKRQGGASGPRQW